MTILSPVICAFTLSSQPKRMKRKVINQLKVKAHCANSKKTMKLKKRARKRKRRRTKSKKR